jgi:hypothetical protein
MGGHGSRRPWYGDGFGGVSGFGVLSGIMKAPTAAMRFMRSKRGKNLMNTLTRGRRQRGGRDSLGNMAAYEAFMDAIPKARRHLRSKKGLVQNMVSQAQF